MEPMDKIRTEVPEDLLREVLARTYPRKLLVRRGIFALFEIMCGTILLFVEIYIYSYGRYIHSKLDIFLGIGALILGLWLLINMVRAPRIETEKWIKNLRIQTGGSSLHLEVQFLAEELMVCNTDVEEELHIPYDYIQTIYILDEVMVLATKQGRINIMRKDISKEEELTQWLVSKCDKIRIKNMQD